MMYKQLSFPTLPDRPYFYTNFVQTIDGKTQVSKRPKDYWPLGSELDYQTLVELRSYADLLIHGKKTATEFKTLNSLSKPEFQEMRSRLGKPRQLPYLVVSAHPGRELLSSLDTTSILATTEEAIIPEELAEKVEVIRCGKEEVDLLKLNEYLYSRGFKHILLEGGPGLMGSFLEKELLDEVFVTITPKLFGSEPGNTLTMIEGSLLTPEKVPTFNLLSVQQVENELFLRYKRS